MVEEDKAFYGESNIDRNRDSNNSIRSIEIKRFFV